MKKQINEIRRMQKLAGILNEERTSWTYNDGGDDIYMTPSPRHPDELLTQHDPEYLDDRSESKTFTKGDYWKIDLRSQPKTADGYIEGDVVRAKKLSNGTWIFYFDSGIISGFKEGEDFKFRTFN